MKTVTIIGGGASGMLTVVNIIKMSTKPTTINIIEPNSIGLGMAFNVDSMNLLLNVPAIRMSCISTEPKHFINWIAEKQLSYGEKDFVPRKIYGQYLSDTYNKFVKSNKLVSVDHIKDLAVDIVLENDSYYVETKAGKNIKSDKVVLALGNYPPNHPKTKSLGYINSPLYISNPLNNNSLDGLGPDIKNVFVLGTGLTAVDSIILVRQKYPKSNIIAFSNHGYLPVQHNLSQTYPSFYDELKGVKTTLEIFKTVNKHIKIAASQQIDYKAVTDSIRPYTQEIWNNLPDEEKLAFLRHLRHIWGVARHRMPYESSNYIYELINFGKIKLFSGKVKEIVEENKHLNITLQIGKKQIEETFSVDCLLNCTGPQTDYEKIDNELVKNILQKGIIQTDKIKYGINTDQNGAIINKENEVSQKIYTIGPPMKGILWECVAIPEIKMQAYKLAEKLTE
ncbi:MAG TPA: FAD/NAD(P)-binding protein [Bacteroidia bacterium]|jgi:uncharacterized NAD(P)/FAD-binding protein YdhS|nr:FAD/NAD(P)-binding protein [Bacteroidia bacterium]